VRAAYDAGPLLDPPTGVGRYTAELADALELQGAELKRYAVSLRGAPNPDIARWRVPGRVARAVWRRFDKPAITRLTGRVDLVHATNFVLPALGRVPGVVTVHDLSFLKEDVFPGGERLRDLVPWSVKRAAKVLVPTEAMAAEVSDAYGLDGDRVVVTYEGIAPVFFGATPLSDGALGKLGIPGPFILAVGTIEPRKNLGRLLAAWSAIRGSLPGWSLVLAGPRGWGPELPATPGVILTGWVGDLTLPGLLAAAELFCYPSLYEGFGLPPLEAMAAGTPVVAGRYSAAAEVLAEGAELVDPFDPDALAETLLRVAGDEALRRRMILAGRAQATSYTWHRTAAATLKAYRSVL
jgi:glycosyltransferase involved in cell wall biosynthesis